MALRTENCIDCKLPIIRAVTASGKEVVVDPDAVLSGQWRLTERPGLRALAASPTLRLAFGVKLYPPHRCTKIRWRKK